MLFIHFMFLSFFTFVDCWDYNPTSWFGKKKADEPSSWQKILYSKYNPYCIFGGCPESGNDDPNWKFLNPYGLIKDYWYTQKHDTFSFNPYCWFYDCGKEKSNGKRFWNNFNFGEFKFSHQKYNPACWAGFCLMKEEAAKSNKPSLWSKIKSNSQSVFHSTKEWIKTAEPSKLVEKLPCWHKECCDKYYIPANMEVLRKLLQIRIHGQPFISTIADALNSHWNAPFKPTKALVISFHGSMGIGKTFTTTLIAESMFKEGIKSQYFHHFHGRKDFNWNENNKEILINWIKSNMTLCPKQVFVFDEVDEMPSTLLNSIKPMINHRSSIDRINYGQGVFVFISNTGSKVILREFERLMETSTREDIELKDFEKLILKEAFNENGGLYGSEMISDNLIDHYIPFLPLERSHIIKCIRDEFKKREISLRFPLDDNVVSQMVDSLIWSSGQNKQFAITGCKMIKEVVAEIYPKKFEPNKNYEL